MCGLRLGTCCRRTALERCLSLDRFGAYFLVSSYCCSKIWAVTRVREDPGVSKQRSQPCRMTYGPGLVSSNIALPLWKAFPIRHRRGCFPISGCSRRKGSTSQLEVSVDSSCSLAEPQRTVSSEQTKLPLVRYTGAGRLWQMARSLSANYPLERTDERATHI